MRKPLSPKLEHALSELAKAAGGGDGPYHILTPAICDLCKDDEKEAFPCGFIADVREYKDLCNDCYAELAGFSYCAGCGWPDDMCVCTDEILN